MATGNREAIRRDLVVNGEASVADVAQRLDLTRSTAQRTIDAMVASGDVRVLPERSTGGRGRRSRSYALAVAPRPVLVYVEAPETVTVRAVTSTGTVVGEASAVRAVAGAVATEEILQLFRDAAADAGCDLADIAGAVVGVPGPVVAVDSVEKAVAPRGDFDSWGTNPPSVRQLQTWDGRNPVAVLRDELGLAAIVENDGNLAALGEANAGAGRGTRMVLHLSLVRTTGGGIVIDGRLRPGRSGMAGELGHISIRPDGALCPCGNRGCFWAEAGFETLRRELSSLAARPLTVGDVADGVAAGDSVFVAALREFGARIGTLIASAVSLLDPDVIIVDGALGAAAEVVARGLREELERSCSPLATRDLQVLSGALGDSAAFTGGATLFLTKA
jgi:predicted NBD/HSP70 family sugar kinase